METANNYLIRKNNRFEDELDLIYTDFVTKIQEYYDFGLVGSALNKCNYTDIDIVATIKPLYQQVVDKVFKETAKVIYQFTNDKPAIINTYRAPQHFPSTSSKTVFHLFFEEDKKWKFASPGCRLVWARTIRPIFQSTLHSEELERNLLVDWSSEIKRYLKVIGQRQIHCWYFNSTGTYVRKKIQYDNEECYAKLLKFALVLSGLAFWYSKDPKCNMANCADILGAGLPVLGQREAIFSKLLKSKDLSTKDKEDVKEICMEVINYLF